MNARSDIVKLQTELFPVQYANSFYENPFAAGHYAIIACMRDSQEVSMRDTS